MRALAEAVVAAVVVCSALCSAQTYDYGIIIDAGSSHSAIYIYQWLPRQSSAFDSVAPFTSPITQAGWTSNSLSALSDFKTNPSQAGASLSGLIAFAKGILNSDQQQAQWAVTPIYLGATAGLRKLAVPIREAIIASVRAYLSDPNTCPFAFSNAQARVISGEEEGAFGWVTLNYALGLLGPAPTAQSARDAYVQYHAHRVAAAQAAAAGVPVRTTPPPYVGALDMGGASTQLTYPPASDIMADYFGLRLPTDSVNLYTHSFLYFGLNEFTFRLNDLVLANANATGAVPLGGVVSHPCFNAGFIEPYLSPNTGKWVNFTGASDYATCTALSTQLLVKGAVCWTPNQCSFSGVYQPPLSGAYVGFSAFASVYQSSLLDSSTSLQQMRANASYICSLTYAQLNAQYPSKYRATSCTGLAYYSALLVSGYGFDPAEPPGAATFRIASNINGYDLGWALGGILFQANGMPWSLPPLPSTDGVSKGTAVAVAVILSTLLVVMSFACVVFYFKHQSLKQQLHSVDDPLIANSQ